MAVRGLLLVHRASLLTRVQHPLPQLAAAHQGSRFQAICSRLQSRSFSYIPSLPHRSSLRPQAAGGSRSSTAAAAAAALAGRTAAAMDADVQQLVAQIHDAPTQAVLYATGGGFQVRRCNERGTKIPPARRHWNTSPSELPWMPSCFSKLKESHMSAATCLH